ncbi:MAG: sigma-70 family RNA polymerase sigma factor [Bryobacteraceae bacterium]
MPQDKDDRRQFQTITKLLEQLNHGNRAAEEELIPIVYRELRLLAARYMRRERKDHTLQPTALVHEAYLKLMQQQAGNWQNRAHFFAIASQVMRRILVDHARSRRAVKRGGLERRVTLNEGVFAAGNQAIDLIILDEALHRLAEFDERQSRIVELRFFGGLSLEEIAVVLDMSPRTVKRDWSVARAWLYGELRDQRGASLSGQTVPEGRPPAGGRAKAAVS